MAPEILGPNGRPAVADVRPSGLRCGICGRRPQLPETTNPRNIKEAGCPAAGDEVGGIFWILAACTECFELYQAVIRRALGILRPEEPTSPRCSTFSAPVPRCPRVRRPPSAEAHPNCCQPPPVTAAGMREARSAVDAIIIGELTWSGSFSVSAPAAPTPKAVSR